MLHLYLPACASCRVNECQWDIEGSLTSGLFSSVLKKDAWDADSDDEKKAEAAAAEKSAAAAPAKPKKKTIKQVCLVIPQVDGL